MSVYDSLDSSYRTQALLQSLIGISHEIKMIKIWKIEVHVTIFRVYLNDIPILGL